MRCAWLKVAPGRMPGMAATMALSLPAAGEDFDVAFVGREQWDQAGSQAAFSAHPRDDWAGHGQASAVSKTGARL